MALLDVDALVALAWDPHVHHVAIRRWFATNSAAGWATCSVTESRFVRVSSNPSVLPGAIGVEAAREVLARLRVAGAHRFVVDDVSMTDAHLLTLARRAGPPVVTFDAGLAGLARAQDVELLAALWPPTSSTSPERLAGRCQPVTARRGAG